jgi:hypothetical protein
VKEDEDFDSRDFNSIFDLERAPWTGDVDPGYGGIVGEAEIVDCVTSHPSEFFFGPFGFVIRNARPLPFRPCRGMLGFFEPDFTPRPPKEPKPRKVAKSEVDLFS